MPIHETPTPIYPYPIPNFTFDTTTTRDYTIETPTMHNITIDAATIRDMTSDMSVDIPWSTPDARWDISPGFEKAIKRIVRETIEECLSEKGFIIGKIPDEESAEKAFDEYLAAQED